MTEPKRTAWGGSERSYRRDDLRIGAGADAEAHVAAVDLDPPVAFALAAARAGRRHHTVAARPERERGHRRLLAWPDVDRRSVDLVARDQLVEPPGVVGAGIAGEGRGESHHLVDQARPKLGDFAGEDSAQAPADEDHRPAAA